MKGLYDLSKDERITLQLIDALASPAQFAARQGMFSMIHHMITVRPYELMSIDHFARIGSLTLAPEADRVKIASGTVPMIALPDPTGSEKNPHPLGQELDPSKRDISSDSEVSSAYETLWERTKYIYEDMLSAIPAIEVDVWSGDEPSFVTDGVLVKEGGVTAPVARVTPSWLTIMFDAPKLQAAVNVINSLLARLRPFGSGYYAPIGWAAKKGDDSGNKWLAPSPFMYWNDPNTCRYSFLATRPWDYAHSRLTAMNQVMLALSSKESSMALGDREFASAKGKLNEKLLFHSYAAIDLGLLTNFDDRLERGVQLNDPDLLKKIYPFLVEPFSRGYMGMDPCNVLRDSDRIRKWMLHNILRYLISQRTSCPKGDLELQYLGGKIPWHQAKALAPLGLKAPYSMGGSDPFYMQTPFDPKVYNLTSPLPYPYVGGKESKGMELHAVDTKPLSPKTLDVRYGEYTMPGTDDTKEEYHRFILKINREGRISEHLTRYYKFLVIRQPIVAVMPKQNWAFQMMSYLSGYGDIPGSAAAIGTNSYVYSMMGRNMDPDHWAYQKGSHTGRAPSVNVP